MAEVVAKAKYVRVSPKKVRQVAYLIRGKTSTEALGILKNLPQRTAYYIKKVLASALANAKQTGMSLDDLRLKSLIIERGPSLKRFRPTSMGRGAPVLHRTSHVKVVLSDEWDKK